MTQAVRSAEYNGLPGHRQKNATSEQAAVEIALDALKLREAVMQAYLIYGAMTPDECAAKLNKSVLSIRPRVSALHKDKLLFKTGKRRKNASGRMAEEYEA